MLTINYKLQLAYSDIILQRNTETPFPCTQLVHTPHVTIYSTVKQFLDDSTNGHAYGTMLHPSVICL